jgi:hypothetical protein
MAKSMMISGMINATILSMAIRYLYPVLGVVYGTIAAAAAGVAVSICSYFFSCDMQVSEIKGVSGKGLTFSRYGMLERP